MSRERRIIRELRAAGFTVLSRKQWGSEHRALYQWRRINRHFSGKAKALFAHVTVTNRSGDFAADVRVVENIGFDRFGTGISYNYAVDQKTGAIAIGMPHDAAGAHTLNDKGVAGFPSNLNYYGHAIAWIANVGDTPSQRCKDAYAAIIAAEKKHGAAERDAGIYPHSKFAWKECPLEVMRAALDAIIRKSKTILEGDDDMAYSDWPQKDRDALVADVKHGVLDEADLWPGNKARDMTVRTAVGRTVTVLDALRDTLGAIRADCKDDATRRQLANVERALAADHDEIREEVSG